MHNIEERVDAKHNALKMISACTLQAAIFAAMMKYGVDIPREFLTEKKRHGQEGQTSGEDTLTRYMVCITIREHVTWYLCALASLCSFMHRHDVLACVMVANSTAISHAVAISCIVRN